MRQLDDSWRKGRIQLRDFLAIGLQHCWRHNLRRLLLLGNHGQAGPHSDLKISEQRIG
jgi:hypothetical protein